MGFEHEVFADAPLAWVACEVRFPLAPGLTDEGSFRSLAEAFFDTFPIPMELTFSDGEMDGRNAVRQIRFLNKVRTMSVSLTRSSLTVETTDYKEWGPFKSVVISAVEIIADLARIVGVERVGLRYINEIQIPEEIDNASGWKGWISESVLGQFEQVPGYLPESSLTVIHLKRGASGLEIRYAALEGRGVVSDEPLKRRHPAPDGPFFVIDTDSFYDTPGEEMLDFNPEVLTPVLDELHDPVEAVFQTAITEKSRNLFRGMA